MYGKGRIFEFKKVEANQVDSSAFLMVLFISL